MMESGRTNEAAVIAVLLELQLGAVLDEPVKVTAEFYRGFAHQHHVMRGAVHVFISVSDERPVERIVDQMVEDIVAIYNFLSKIRLKPDAPLPQNRDTVRRVSFDEITPAQKRIEKERKLRKIQSATVRMMSENQVNKLNQEN